MHLHLLVSAESSQWAPPLQWLLLIAWMPAAMVAYALQIHMQPLAPRFKALL
jgi:hypothetical protein